jgi:hypothetical protein
MGDRESGTPEAVAVTPGFVYVAVDDGVQALSRPAQVSRGRPRNASIATHAAW